MTLTCLDCGSDKVENIETMLCASCASEKRKSERLAAKPPKAIKPIRKVSRKISSQIIIYAKERLEFLKGKKCPVYPEDPVTDIHHQKGRAGYADDWAKQRGNFLFDAETHRAKEDKRFAWVFLQRQILKTLYYHETAN